MSDFVNHNYIADAQIPRIAIAKEAGPRKNIMKREYILKA
jgi:hypothetical protein